MRYATHPTYFIHRRPVLHSLEVGRGIRKYSPGKAQAKRQRVTRELVASGATKRGATGTEGGLLPLVLGDNEHIKAMVRGRHMEGSAMLAATTQRVLFICTTPFYAKSDELEYGLVDGVHCKRNGLLTTLILYTGRGDYTLRTLNGTAARRFAEYIQDKCFVHKIQRES